ncbi:MAG: HDOD domain-containing protein [Thiobacillus sp.]
MLNRLVGMFSGHRDHPDDLPPPVVVPDPAPAPVRKASSAKPPSVMRREAMLGRKQRVAGYTFMLRRALEHAHEATPPDMQRLYDETLLDNLQRMDVTRLLGQRLAFVPVMPATLLDPIIDDWPATGTVWILKLDAQPRVDAALLARLGELKSHGARFAMQAEDGVMPEWLELLKLAEYVFMDVGSEDIPAITARMAAISKAAAGKQFVATGVQTLEAFHMCHKLQFTTFMGPFITRHEKLDGPTMGPSRTKVLDLMNRVRTGVELPELAEQFRHDPTLSVRLLRYVNSPGMGLLNKVGGIQQALVVMGRDKLYRWLTMILFIGGQAQELDYALLENAMVRGRMAEQLAGHELPAKARDEIFVAGLFSLLDVVMHMSMEQVLKQVRLPADITDAIVKKRGPYAPYLAVAIACEQNDQTHLDALAKQINQTPGEINAAHMDALLWAQELADV